MPRLTSVSFSHDGNRYALEFDLDDSAIMKDQLSVDVVAKVTDRRGREYRETLSVVIDFAEWTAQVLRGDEKLATLDLGLLSKLLPTWDEHGPENDNVVDEFGNQVNRGLGDVVEDVIGSFPVPDPIVGCLIKAGISAIIGQAITCYQNLKVEGLVRRTRAIARCLMQHAGGVFGRAAWRAARCMAALGWA